MELIVLSVIAKSLLVLCVAAGVAVYAWRSF
jgi:hypothetical protein